MCGIIGIVAKDRVNQAIFDGLTALQHRGQDAAGMVTCDADKLYTHKDNGLVREVFRTRHMLKMLGTMGIGHVRYPTAGSDGVAEAQPLYVNSPYGINLAHNGNLTNAAGLAEELSRVNLRHLSTNSDSELLLNVFAHELQKLQRVTLMPENIFQSITNLYQRCRGAFSVVAMITGYGIVGFRDPNGIRPMVYGKRETERGSEYIIASESVALDALQFKLVGDIAPGEAIFISKTGELYRKQCVTNTNFSPCIFEHVYLARPDAILDKVLVYKVRLRMGEGLAEKILQEYPNHDIDVVMPIPDTSRTAAHALANRLGVKFREGYVKNRYIGRTFIMPGQQQRQRSVRQKLNTIPLEFNNKNVLLVDDSIVRGTTATEIIQMARAAGAKKVYFSSAAPAVRYPDVYGINIPSRKELIAHDRSIAEICQAIGADWLLYQDLQVILDAIREGNPDISHFDTSVFTGEYVTDDIDAAYLQRLEAQRG